MQQTALVIGLGMSGLAAAALLHQQGYHVLGFDDRLKPCPSYIEIVTEPFEIRCRQIDLVVVSPGIKPTHWLYEYVVAGHLPMIGEVELALTYLKQKMIAITGTNGKTTVSLLTAHLLRACGFKARALGNIGIPLCQVALETADEEEIFIVELSSYQIETMKAQAFDAGLILNITPDHLDRHGSMEAYARAKCHLQVCLKKGAPLFVAESVHSQFSHLLTPPYSIFSKDRFPVPRALLGQFVRGPHDIENCYGAFLLAQTLGCSQSDMIQGLSSFSIPPHRIEFIVEKNGVRFYDDSKGTNLDAVVQAVFSMPGEVVLIAGGVDKGSAYTPWRRQFPGKVKKMVVLGEAALKIKEELQDAIDVMLVDSMEEAVSLAVSASLPGDCVLLSPGCSSFDMFRDYAHRGEVFQKCVKELEK